MSNYGRIEINLLPPELLPGPAVRFGLLIRVLIVMMALAFIAVDSYYGFIRLGLERGNREGLEREKAGLVQGAADYDALASFGEKISRYGRLVALASTDYAELQLLL